MKKRIHIDERIYILAVFVVIFFCGIWYMRYVSQAHLTFGEENESISDYNAEKDNDIYENLPIDVEDNKIIVNINTADSQTLQYLNGIGPSLSESIIEYRNENGLFEKIEDIKNVPKVGDKIFEQIKDSISV